MKTKTELIIFIVISIVIALALLFMPVWFKISDQPYNDIEPIKTNLEANFSPTSAFPDPCELKNVICPNEPKTIYGKVTKYSKTETCPDRPCITASGQIATRNRTLACPRHIPFGRKVLIGQRTYVCEDRTHYR